MSPRRPPQSAKQAWGKPWKGGILGRDRLPRPCPLYGKPSSALGVPCLMREFIIYYAMLLVAWLFGSIPVLISYHKIMDTRLLGSPSPKTRPHLRIGLLSAAAANL